MFNRLGFGLNVCEMLREEISKKTAESRKKYQNHIFLKVDILLMVPQNPIVHSIF